MLHVAPENCFEARFWELLGEGYVSADLNPHAAMVQMDVSDIWFPDDSFNVIFCSHVLEHVHDDLHVMREFHRVLATDGWAVLMVPITTDETFEDPSVTDPRERLRLFGQENHVRAYGHDFSDRLTTAGFGVKVVVPSDVLDDQSTEAMGISDERLYFCTRLELTP